MRRADPSRRARASDGYEPMIPVGPGLAERLVQIEAPAIVRLAQALSGYDGLASIHGVGPDRIVVVTTASQAPVLDELLAELCDTLGLVLVPSA